MSNTAEPEPAGEEAAYKALVTERLEIVSRRRTKLEQFRAEHTGELTLTERNKERNLISGLHLAEERLERARVLLDQAAD